MKLDRSNYEIWLVDWLDGNLSELRKEELLLFLEENPDLKDEFNDLSAINLLPDDSSFSGKTNLKKTASEINDIQFGFLSAGHLENDLNEIQKAELYEIIENDPGRKTEFELIQKTKLTSPSISYKNKNHLYRRTAFQKTISYSLIGLSSAAAIALLIISAPFSPENQTGSSINIAEVAENDTNKIVNNAEKLPIAIVRPTKRTTRLSEKTQVTAIQKIADVQYAEVVTVNTDTLSFTREEEIRTVNFIPAISLNQNSSATTLIASSSFPETSEYDDGRSRISHFIAKTFRDKILKEDITKDTPLKGYEIAEAGVTGLNKLLGWEMELDKNNDENGELNSVYFSSKILKFNTPVKKTEPLP